MFHSRKCSWKCCLPDISHFVQTLMCYGCSRLTSISQYCMDTHIDYRNIHHTWARLFHILGLLAGRIVRGMACNWLVMPAVSLANPNYQLGYTSPALNNGSTAMHFGLRRFVGISTSFQKQQTVSSPAIAAVQGDCFTCSWCCARRLWKRLYLSMSWKHPCIIQESHNGELKFGSTYSD